MKRLVSIGLVLFTCLAVQAGVVHYTADNTSIFRNPERGFTEELGGELYLTDSKNQVIKPERDKYFDLDDEANADRKTQTLVVLMYYLKNYKETDLSDKILNGFDADMQILREEGFKCVLRFAYDWKSRYDADPTHVRRHIEQLKPYLKKNADVIYVLEAGFVGRWGEWYYSDQFDNKTQQLTPNRRKVVNWLLDACPSDRFLLVRYPMIKAQYLGDTDPLTSSQAFTDATRARIGHHNDAFLNIWGNDGTYVSWDEEDEDDPAVRQYIADETLYVPNGGETNVEEDPDDEETIGLPEKVYAKAEEEMAKYHWSFCGSTYSEQVTSKWRKHGIYAELDRKMGYRYQLVTATLPDEANAGGQANIRIQIKNVGFAPLYNERHAYVVLKNGSNTYPIALQSDPRRWLPNGAVTTIDEQVTIPADVPVGTYQLYLHMPDKYASLAADPRYAIRFANTDVWDETTGMNDLHATVTIHEATEGLEDVPTPTDTQAYDVLGRPVNSSYHGIVIRNRQKYIQ